MTSARASETRIRMPPESCAGMTLRRRRRDRPLRSRARGVAPFAGGAPLQLERQRDVLEHVAPRQQVRVLEHVGEGVCGAAAVAVEPGSRRRRAARGRRSCAAASTCRSPRDRGSRRTRRPRSTRSTASTAIDVGFARGAEDAARTAHANGDAGGRGRRFGVRTRTRSSGRRGDGVKTECASRPALRSRSRSRRAAASASIASMRRTALASSAAKARRRSARSSPSGAEQLAVVGEAQRGLEVALRDRLGAADAALQRPLLAEREAARRGARSCRRASRCPQRSSASATTR